MCGICGIFSNRKSRFDSEYTGNLLSSMCNMMIHRGPDDDGFMINSFGGMAMRRLSIIDLEGGKQPIFNENRDVSLVCNGEIYNYMEQRKFLEGRGHRFSTGSDVEVIIHLYEEFGETLLTRLRGMFAFALFDERKGSLFLARDRLGIKPLYYARLEDGLLFSSELKSLLLHPDVDRSIDIDGLSEYLTFQHTMPPRTMLSGVRKLAAGQTLSMDREKGITFRTYWDLSFNVSEMTMDEAVQRFSSVFTETVEGHLMSEVPLGIFLSGGLDSSAVTAEAARLTHQPVRTFSVGYKEGDIYGELKHARQVAEYVGAVHSELLIGPEDYASALNDFVWFSDEPVADEASIPLLLLSRMVKDNGVTVMLSGEGADEILGGYSLGEIQRRFDRRRRIKGLLGPLGIYLGMKGGTLIPGKPGKRLSDAFRPDHLVNIEELPSMIKTFDMKGKLEICPPVRQSTVDCDEEIRNLYLSSGTNDPVHQIMYVYTKMWLPENVLIKADKMTMAASVELRVPFLDHVLVETAASFSSRLKVANTGKDNYEIKNILKLAMKDKLPRNVIYRKKLGFPVPISEWFRKGLEGTLKETLLGKDARESGLYDQKNIRKLIDNHNNTPNNNSAFRLKNLLIFEKWRKIVVDGVDYIK